MNHLAVTDDGLVNDVSRLHPTPVYAIRQYREVEELVAALAEARRRNLKVSISGMRHSQGGHAFYEGALVLDMRRFNRVIALDRQKRLIRVQSGVTWRQVQDFINPYGLSVKVMQSSNIFTVGGSLSVNAHGRDPTYGPIIETVESFRLLLPDGDIVHVSRNDRPELFRLVIGGFGMFGVILDVDLSLTSNALFRKETALLDYRDYPAFFDKHVRKQPTVGLHYARLSTARDTLLREMYATNFVMETREPGRGVDLSVLDTEEHIVLPRFFLGLARKSDWGKRVNWYLLKTVVDVPGKVEWISRNNAMRPAVAFLDYESASDTDILQEYFVPVEHFVAFVDRLREIVLRHNVNLLNLTVRYVPSNYESVLSYAQRDSFALVLYINQSRSPQGIAEAQAWTRDLVDLCHDHEGTYFLPYQLYPTREQMRRSYPAADHFFARKREYDPERRFMSKFYSWYGEVQ